MDVQEGGQLFPVVPVTGEDIQSAVRSGDFAKALLQCGDEAVNL